MKQLMHSIRHMEDSTFESIEFDEFDLGRPKYYCANPKTVNTRIIFGILLCCEEKANQMQDGKTARCNGN